MKVCKVCNIEKSLDEFYLVKRRNGEHNRDCTCSDCRKLKNRERSRQPEYIEARKLRHQANSKNEEYVNGRKEYLSGYYNSLNGRAKSLYKSVLKRSNTDRFGETDITEDFIIDRLMDGKCEVTGIDFQYENKFGTFKNPFSPSIDRIDSTKGYLKDNVRFVIWQVNLMKGELTDQQFIDIFKKLYESLLGKEV